MPPPDEEIFFIPQNFPPNVAPHAQKHFDRIKNNNHYTQEHLQCFKRFITEVEMTDFWQAVNLMPESLPDPCPRPVPFTVESVFQAFFMAFLNWSDRPTISKREHNKTYENIESSLKKIKAECLKDKRIKADLDYFTSRIISQTLEKKNHEKDNTPNFTNLNYPNFIVLIESFIKTIENRRELGLEDMHYNFFPKRVIKEDTLSLKKTHFINSFVNIVEMVYGKKSPSKTEKFLECIMPEINASIDDISATYKNR